MQYDWESRGQKLNKQWEKMFNLLKMYKLEFGHMGVTRKKVYHSEGIGKWVLHQQSAYRDGKIIDHRNEKLNKICFPWIKTSASSGKEIGLKGNMTTIGMRFLVCLVNTMTRDMIRWSSNSNGQAGRQNRCQPGEVC